MLRIVFCHIYTSHGNAVGYHRGSGNGMHYAVVIGPCKYVVSFHCLNNFGEQGIFTQRTVDSGIVNHHSGLVGDNEAADLQIHLGNGLPCTGGVQHFQTSNFRGGKLCLFHHGSLFALIENTLDSNGAINIQKNQNR